MSGPLRCGAGERPRSEAKPRHLWYKDRQNATCRWRHPGRQAALPLAPGSVPDRPGSIRSSPRAARSTAPPRRDGRHHARRRPGRAAAGIRRRSAPECRSERPTARVFEVGQDVWHRITSRVRVRRAEDRRRMGRFGGRSMRNSGWRECADPAQTASLSRAENGNKSLRRSQFRRPLDVASEPTISSFASPEALLYAAGLRTIVSPVPR